MDVLRLVTIIILLVAGAMLIAEVISEEVEIFGPLAAITLIAGIILLFMSDPQEWFELSEEGFITFIISVVILAVVLLGFTGYLYKNVHNLHDIPLESNKYQGKPATIVVPFEPGKEGVVQFEGSKWGAYSVDSEEYTKGEEVIIAGADGLKLIVRKKTFGT